MESVIEIKNLTVEYKTPEGFIGAVRDFTLMIGEGETFTVNSCAKPRTSTKNVMMPTSLGPPATIPSSFVLAIFTVIGDTYLNLVDIVNFYLEPTTWRNRCCRVTEDKYHNKK